MDRNFARALSLVLKCVVGFAVRIALLRAIWRQSHK